MTERPEHPDGSQRIEYETPEPRVDTYNCAEPAFLQAEREFRKAREFERRVLAPCAKASLERMERERFGEVGKERSRRKMFYSHNWSTREGYSPQTPVIAQDAALLAENCGVPLQLSSDNPELGPMFGPDLILCNGGGDSCDDFRYPPDAAVNPAAGRRANSGRCKTELRDYDTLVCAILPSVKHHLGDSSYARAGGTPDGAGWRDAFEIYRRTFPEREMPVARQLSGNWTLLLSLVARPHHCANTPSSLTFRYTEDSQVTSQKHQQLSEHLLAEARQELAAGGLPQASEYGWGATTQILKAIAEQRGGHTTATVITSGSPVGSVPKPAMATSSACSQRPGYCMRTSAKTICRRMTWPTVWTTSMHC